MNNDTHFHKRVTLKIKKIHTSLRKIQDGLVGNMGAIVRTSIYILTALCIIFILPEKKQGVHYDFSVNGFWNDEDLYAPYEFAVTNESDDHEIAQATAKSKSILYFTVDSTARLRAMERLTALHHSIRPHEMRKLRLTVDSIYKRGYIELPLEIPDLENHTIVILQNNIGSEHRSTEFVAPYDIPNDLLIDSVLVPSIAFDSERTQMELDSRLSQSQYTSEIISANQLIIQKGERIDKRHARILKSLQAENDRRFMKEYNPWLHYLGHFLLCCVILTGLWFLLRHADKSIVEVSKKLIMIVVTILLMVGLTTLMLYWRSDWILAVPLCIGPFVLQVFLGTRPALYTHFATLLILGLSVPDNFEFVLYHATSGTIALLLVHDYNKRSRLFLACLIIFCVYSLIYTFGILWQDTNLSNLNPQRYALFLINAILTVLVQFIIYIYERVFKITSQFTLMELANTDSPGLKDMQRFAHGTFEHCVQVANISEEVVNEIGGNALLTKVGALYHDLGKIDNPLYFTENQKSGYNPHNDIQQPEKSSEIVRHHITDGLRLSVKYKLPTEIQDFIRTHHGTTTTGYFFQIYKNQHPGETIDPTKFQYPGPIPFSRETAVVMIADSVEAACKSLKEPTEAKVKALIESIISAKLENGQLNNCDLSFRDLQTIGNMLVKKIMSIYHVRIAYPTVNNSDKK